MTETAPECSFDTFIDADLVLDSTSSEEASSPSGHAIGKSGTTKPSPLASVSGHFSHDGPPTPTISEGFHYHPNASTTSTSSPLVTTPNSALSHPASLHNLSFDFSFIDGSHGQSSASPFSTDVHAAVAAKDAIATGLPAAAVISRPTSSPSAWDGLGAPTVPGPFLHQASSRHQQQQQQQHHQQHHHHGRSLSLHDVAPPTSGSDVDATMAQLPFPPVKVKMESEADSNVPSPLTEDRSSPSSSQPSMSIFDHGSPPMEKKRRLASPAESFTSFTSSVKSGTDASTSMSTDGPSTPLSAKKSSTSSSNSGNQKRSRNNTLTKQPDQQQPQQQALAEGNQDKSSTVDDQQLSQLHQQQQQEAQQQAQQQQRAGNKRPPPSASQFTESGMPFPVIDTSAKHSSLFVPPDTSGLTKREARLVKNRAAAFLSRQRKREQFEELDQKCKHLCRATWRMWEVIVGPGRGWEAFSSSVLPMLMAEEHAEVALSLEQVVMLKGGSIAPTEDGQLQGAVAAGIDMKSTSSTAASSANSRGSETPSAPALGPASGPVDAAAAVVAPPPAPNATKVEDQGEITRLRAEIAQLQESQAALRLELANERALRSESELEQQRRPFRPSAQASQDISLTVAPEEHSERRRGPAKGSRSSERIQRQQVASSLAPQQGGQRKAAGAALMMVLFSFALFGLPGGQMTRLGGVSTTGNVDE